MIIFSFICFLIVLALLISVVMPGFLNDINVGFYLTIITSFALAWFIILIRKRFSFFKTLSIYVCAFLTFFILTEAAMIYFSSDDIPTGKEQAIIVPGRGLFVESRLTDELAKRLDTAIEIYSQNPDLPIVLSGGTDADRALPECVAMKDYLEKKITVQNMDMPIIITEEKSTTIYENIKNSFEISGLNSAYVIVSRHNVPRTKILVNRLYKASTVVGADYPASKYIIYYIREFGFSVKTFLSEGIF